MPAAWSTSSSPTSPEPPAPPASRCPLRPLGSNFETGVWGETGTALLPAAETSAIEALQLAAEELVAAAESGESHPVDVAFGTRIVELLAAAELQLA